MAEGVGCGVTRRVQSGWRHRIVQLVPCRDVLDAGRGPHVRHLRRVSAQLLLWRGRRVLYPKRPFGDYPDLILGAVLRIFIARSCHFMHINRQKLFIRPPRAGPPNSFPGTGAGYSRVCQLGLISPAVIIYPLHRQLSGSSHTPV